MTINKIRQTFPIWRLFGTRKHFDNCPPFHNQRGFLQLLIYNDKQAELWSGLDPQGSAGVAMDLIWGLLSFLLSLPLFIATDIPSWTGNLEISLKTRRKENLSCLWLCLIRRLLRNRNTRHSNIPTCVIA